jgi:hypothetical protein
LRIQFFIGASDTESKVDQAGTIRFHLVYLQLAAGYGAEFRGDKHFRVQRVYTLVQKCILA